MRWEQISVIARTLPAVEVAGGRAPIAKVRGVPFASLVEDGTAVLFAVADAGERQRLLASDGAIYFTTPRYADLDAVLVTFDRLDHVRARTCLERAWRARAPVDLVAAADAPEAPVVRARMAHCYWLSFWKRADRARERRRFRRYPAASLLDWFASGWRVAATGEPWPATPEDVLHYIRQRLDRDAEPHFIHGDTDDDEGTEIEFFMFDDAFLATPDALGRLPNPARGARRDDDDDKYRALVDTPGVRE